MAAFEPFPPLGSAGERQISAEGFALPPGYHLRPAQAADAAAIRRLVWRARINPLGLDWRRFWLVTFEERLAAMGQVKPHAGGLRELASIATEPAHRGKGLARGVILTLMAQHSPPLYLTCRAELRAFYQPFGFTELGPEEMPPYYRRLWKLVRLLRPGGREEGMAVMRWLGVPAKKSPAEAGEDGSEPGGV